LATASYKAEEVKVGTLKASQIKRLASYLLPYKKQVILTVLLMLAAALAELISPYLLQRAIDIYIPNKDIAGLLFISVAMIGSVALNYFLNRQKISIANRTGQYVLLDIRKAVFNNVQRLSFRFFDNTSAGRITVRVVNDVDTLNNLFTNGVINILTDFSMLFVAAGLMIAINPKLALVGFTTVPLFGTIIVITKNSMKKTWRIVRSKISNLNSYIHESLAGMRVTQAYCRQAKNRLIFHSVIKDVCDSWMNAIKVNAAFGPMIEVISVIGTIVIYWYGARLLKIDAVTVGVLVSFTSYLKRFWHPIITLTNFYNQLLVAMASAERIFELIDEEPDIYDLPDAKELKLVKGSVEFQNVTFSYDNKKTVLKNVSFKVNPGETIAFVGHTGSGKSTIINLLSRFYDPTKGRILIDGQDIKHVTVESLRKKIGIMLQEPFIFSGTVAENIRYGKLDATDEEVVRVAKAVDAHDFIVEMEDGYNTVLNERGSRLSVGQRQLIAFARVLLADPEILILDEATASIDTHTEILLQNAIEKILEGRTSFVIAHRLSTIRNASRIMLVRDGEIIEEGTHDELMAARGEYYQMYMVQSKELKAS